MPVEIPNNEILYRYASPDAFPEDQQEIPHGIFVDVDLSCDWRKFRMDPRTSFHVHEGRSIIISIKVCDEIKFPHNPRGVPKESAYQEVIHDPTDETCPTGKNDAHSLIKGRKKAEAVTAIKNNSIWGRVEPL